METVDAPGNPDVPAVTGRIVIPASTSGFKRAVVHIWLEDVSYADQKAIVVGEAVLFGVDHEPERSSEPGTNRNSAVTFVVQPSTAIEPTHDYNIRIWLDRDGDGIAGPGDLWSNQNHRVLTRGFGCDVTITLVER